MLQHITEVLALAAGLVDAHDLDGAPVAPPTACDMRAQRTLPTTALATASSHRVAKQQVNALPALYLLLQRQRTKATKHKSTSCMPALQQLHELMQLLWALTCPGCMPSARHCG